MRSQTTFDLQYAHRFYGFKGEAQYLHGHTGTLTIEVEDTVNAGVNMVFPCNEIQKTAWDVLKNFTTLSFSVRTTRCCLLSSTYTKSKALRMDIRKTP